MRRNFITIGIFVFLTAGLLIAGWGLLAGNAFAVGGSFPVTVIYTNLPGDPSADVPGLPGVHFQPGTSTTHFDRVYGSQNGNWALTADTDLPVGEDEVFIVNNVVRALEGMTATWTTGESIGFLETKVGVNDSGEYIFATNTDGPTTADEYMVTGIGSAQTAAARESDPTNLTALPGSTWGSTLESGVIAADGTVGLVSDAIGGVPSTEDEIAVYSDTVRGQEGVTIPPGQIGNEFWENFDVNDYWISADGSDWLIQGDLTGDTTTDDVAVVNGSVVVQEGVILAGSTYTTPVDGSGIVGVHMDPAGNWFVRGNNDSTEQDWVYRNGAVIAQGGDPIFAGATENWDDTDFGDLYFLHVGNGNGDYVIGGVTDAPSAANGVLVLNNTTVIVRESDPIDLDGNGNFDDNLFFDTFGNDDALLTDTGLLYIVATVKDDTDTRLGQGLFVIDLIGGGTSTPTAIPPTVTSLPPTVTSIPPTVTSLPPTVTSLPPTVTSLPPTVTSLPPTVTSLPPTVTSIPPTVTSIPPTETPTGQPPTETPTGEPPTPSSTPMTTGVELTTLTGDTSSLPVFLLVVGLILLALGLNYWLRKQE